MRSLIAVLLMAPVHVFGTEMITYRTNQCNAGGNVLPKCDASKCCFLGSGEDGPKYYKINDIQECARTGIVTIDIFNSRLCRESSRIQSNAVTASTNPTCQTVGDFKVKFRQLSVEFSRLECQIMLQQSEGNSHSMTMEMYLGPGCLATPVTTEVLPLWTATSRMNTVLKRGVNQQAVSCPIPQTDVGIGGCQITYDHSEGCTAEYSRTEMTCNGNNQIHFGRMEYRDASCTQPKSFLGSTAPTVLSIPINGQCVNVLNGFMSVRASTNSPLITSLCQLVNSDSNVRQQLGYTDYQTFIGRYPVPESGGIIAPTLFALVLLVLTVLI